LQSVRGRLENARSDEDLREAIDYMWGVALQLEDGNLSLAERRLRDAQNALAEALENGATDEEIAQLMDELREAMQEFSGAGAAESEQS
jgi:vacuolar-type H+-ATPase subunit E/Vma4